VSALMKTRRTSAGKSAGQARPVGRDIKFRQFEKILILLSDRPDCIRPWAVSKADPMQEDPMNDQTAKQALPKVLGGLTPYLGIDGATKAAEFYKKAFSAEEAFAIPPDDKGRTMHIHLYVNGSSLM